MRTGLSELLAWAREHPDCGHGRMREWTVRGQQLRACVECVRLLEGEWTLRPGRTYKGRLIEEAH